MLELQTFNAYLYNLKHSSGYRLFSGMWICYCFVSICQRSFQRMQRPSTGLPGSAPFLRDCRRLTEQDWHLVERSQEELAALAGWKDGLSELRCLALLEAGGMQGVQQHQQSPAGAGKALQREVGVARAQALPATEGFGEWKWFWTKWFCQREPQYRVVYSVSLSLTYSCEGADCNYGTWKSQENLPHPAVP